jgi:hypothetical protein
VPENQHTVNTGIDAGLGKRVEVAQLVGDGPRNKERLVRACSFVINRGTHVRNALAELERNGSPIRSPYARLSRP